MCGLVLQVSCFSVGYSLGCAGSLAKFSSVAEWKPRPDQRREAIGGVGVLIVPGTSKAQYDGQLGSP